MIYLGNWVMEFSGAYMHWAAQYGTRMGQVKAGLGIHYVCRSLRFRAVYRLTTAT